MIPNLKEFLTKLGNGSAKIFKDTEGNILYVDLSTDPPTLVSGTESELTDQKNSLVSQIGDLVLQTLLIDRVRGELLAQEPTDLSEVRSQYTPTEESASETEIVPEESEEVPAQEEPSEEVTPEVNEETETESSEAESTPEEAVPTSTPEESKE